MKSGKPLLSQYSQIREEAERIGAKIFFVDEAHFRADADLRGKWVLKGEPALVDSTSPRWGEKACYYSGVCLESGEVEAMEIAGNSNAETSTAFLQQLRENHPGPLVVTGAGASGLSLPVGKDQSYPAQPGVGRRHHLLAHGPGIPLPGGHHGLAQPVRGGLAIVQQLGGRLLRRRPTRDTHYHIVACGKYYPSRIPKF